MSIHPIQVLTAKAEAHALLFTSAEYEDLGEAITPLLVYAHETELVELLGSEGVLTIIRKAFEDVAEI